MSAALMVRGAGGRYRRADKCEVLHAAAQLLVQETRAPYDAASPQRVREFLRVALAAQDSEQFACVWLDNSNRVIGFDVLFTGTVDRSAVHPREVLKRLLERNAVSVIFAHNHPSGKLEPSQADELITKRLKDALALVDARVLDHVIVTREGFFSFVEQGLL